MTFKSNMKKLTSIWLCLFIALTLAACGGRSAGTVSEASGAASSYEGSTLRVIFATHDWTTAIMDRLGDFEAATGIRVEYEVYPENQLSDKLNIELGSGGQYIDVFMCRPLQEAQRFIQNGYLAEMNDLLDKPSFDSSDLLASALNGFARSGADDGKYYGVPLVSERQILMYRKDLFAKAGIEVPTSLDEMMEAAAALNGIEDGVVGFVGRGKPNPAVTAFAAYLFGFGGDFVDYTANKAVINSPEAVRAFTYYGDLIRSYGVGLEAGNMHWNECAAVYSTGGAAMCTDADSVWRSFCGPDTEVYDKTGFAVAPHNATWNVCSWGLGVSANSPNLEAAKAFVEWAAGIEMTKYVQSAGIPSARSSAWADPACTANFPGELLDAIQKSNELSSKAYDRPLTTSVSEARDIIGTVITAAIEGRDVQKAADKANAELQSVLDADFAALG